MSQLEDTDFFPDTHPANAKPDSDSDSDSESDSDFGTDTDSGSDSDSDDSSSCDDSGEDEEEGVEIVWAKAARGVWGLEHVFEGKLYFTKDIVDDNFVPKDTKLKAVPEPPAKPAPKAAPKPAPKGKHVQLFKMKRKIGKGFYSVPVNQNNDLCYHVGRVKVGLCLQLVFRSTCRALTRACPNMGTPCFRTFGPGTRTWPVFAQGGGGGYVSRASCALVQATVGVGTVLLWDFCVARTGGKGDVAHLPTCGPLLILSPALKCWGPATRQE